MYPLKQNLFRNSIMDVIIKKLNYFGDKITIHGIRHVFSLSYIPFYERFFWIVILIISCLSASIILRLILNMYSGGAVSYLMDTNYIEFQTPFPAVTLCQLSDMGRVKAYITKNGLPTSLLAFYTNVGLWYHKYCKKWCLGNTCVLNVTCVDNFTDAVQELRAPCTDLLTQCWFDGTSFPCCERFLPVETEYGVCFVFNSRLTGNVTVVSHSQITNLPSLVFSAKEDVGIRIHSPYDMVSVDMENALGKPVMLPLISNFEVILKAEITTSDPPVEFMAPSARKCLYDYERPEHAKYWNFKIYTYSTCKLYCRAMAQLDLCNCTHHMMPDLGENVPVCDSKGIICLSMKKDMFGTQDCDCPLSCEEVLYTAVHIFNTRETTFTPELVARGTRGRVYLGQLPSLRVQRVAIRHTLGFVVDIGGVLGVFFSASLLSVLEIIYLLCLRRTH